MDDYEGWDLWRRWVLAHLTGAALGIVVGVVAGAIIGGVSLFVCAYCAILVGPAAGWIAFALVLGWAQQMVLWPYATLPWSRNTLLGFVVALPIGVVAGGGTVLSPLNWMAAGAVGGTILAVAQWLVLRTASARAGVWIPANTFAWALGGAVAYMVNAFLTSATGLATLQNPLAFLAPVLDPLASTASALVVVAAVTGFALLWIEEAAGPRRSLLRRQ